MLHLRRWVYQPSSCLLVLFCNGGVFISKGGSKVVVEPHIHGGVFIAKGKEDDLCTKTLVPGETVYNEKKIYVQLTGAATTNLHHKWLTKMELGFGIHKELGAAVVDLQSVDVVVSHVLKEILSPV
ncbi:hypothetical protein KY290_031128 [Solanum tuberosum]|uniref:Uncharacterized protein n=1 Tax=Solanum tuberosum TaxID=4113 RepID=A0ABQ7UBR6_SOLTU|nr:hypothetical protein KY290_031128 [Solanum tuberosum]